MEGGVLYISPQFLNYCLPSGRFNDNSILKLAKLIIIPLCVYGVLVFNTRLPFNNIIVKHIIYHYLSENRQMFQNLFGAGTFSITTLHRFSLTTTLKKVLKAK